jgi:hypothetical protein
MGLEISAGVRGADFFLRRAGLLFSAVFFGALLFLVIIFFFGLADLFADFFLRAGFFLAMREVYHSYWGGTTGSGALLGGRKLRRRNLCAHLNEYAL